MMWRNLLGCIVVAGCIGCSGNDNGDVVGAKKGADAAPKSAADLPKDMPKEAQAAAAAAIGQAKAQEQMNSDPARIHAMQMMQQQKHH